MANPARLPGLRRFRWRQAPQPEREPATGHTRQITALIVAALVLAAAVTGGLLATVGRPGPNHLTAYFSAAVGVYPGSDVRILGVQVGTVNAVQPEGQQVKVTMTVDHDVAVPAGADAVVIAPSVIADRYVQLAPAYTAGPRLADGAVIPASRTATPLEIDQLYSSLSKLASELGPNGVNKHGALSDALNTGAANLAGNGKALGTMIDQLGAATRTLSGSQNNLFGTIGNLQQFTGMLQDNDSQVRQAEQQLAQVTGFLAGDRQSLAAALSELATALSQVKGFIQANRHGVQANVSKLQAITQLLVNQRASLAEALDDAPLAVDNLLNAYDPANGTLDGRGDLNELSLGAGAYTGPSAASPSGATGQLSSSAPLPLPAIGAASPGSGTGTGSGRG